MPTYHLTAEETRLIKGGLEKMRNLLDNQAKQLDALGYQAEAGKMRADASAISEDLLPKFDEQLSLAMGGSAAASDES